MTEKLRQIVLDTETTGLSPTNHRIIEIACLELENFSVTGRHLQAYINPMQPVSAEAEAIHGLSNTFLEKHPPFTAFAQDILNFIDGAPLIIHNASFDLSFLHEEFKRLNKTFPPFSVIDTLSMARKKFPGSPASLDALCRRFNVNLSSRDKHGALIDCQLLASVYIELLGGPQRLLNFDVTKKEEATPQSPHEKKVFPTRSFRPTYEEEKNHQKLVNELQKSPWHNFYIKN